MSSLVEKRGCFFIFDFKSIGMNKVFSQVWEQLRGKKASMPDYLESVVIRNLRGIAELTNSLDF